MNEALKILILEDDAGLNELIRRRLAREGHDCYCFQRAEEVLEWLSQNDADLMVLDLMLPDYTGEELITILKNNNIEIPFIVATGQGSEAIAVKLLKKGARDYLVKNAGFLDTLPAAVEMVWREIQLETLLDKARAQLSIQNATLSAVYEFSPEGIMVVDYLDKIVSFNHRLLDLSGLPQKDLNGKSRDFFKNFATRIENGQEFLDSVLNVLPEAKGLVVESFKTGDRIFELYTCPTTGDDDSMEPHGRIWYFRDISIHVKAQETMAQAIREAEKNAEMRSRFFAVVSHDVKAPLGAIKGFVDLLDRTDMSEEQREYTEIIKSSSEHLLTLIGDILDLSRIEHGEMDFHIQMFSSEDLFQSCINTFIPKAKEAGIELLSEISGDVPEIINGDLVRVKQVIFNLMGNAMKFTRKGYVKLKCSMKDADTLLIEVIDTGIGISEKAQEYIFSPFSQADSKVQHEYGGYGLGLAISKQLVDRMGGALSLKSEVDKGTTFTFVLPVNTVLHNHN
jgi:nitrogen-specific signal transduction histidine kinase/FixJ family two-component response regulator